MSKLKSRDKSGIGAMKQSMHNPWRFRFPNTADFNFNYWKLLNDASGTAIAEPPSGSQPRIAIIGAGVAGLTAGRELFRSGYKNIDIYESTGRIGGRTFSLPSRLPDGVTTFELGAMRLPFFWPWEEGKPSQNRGRGSQNCVLDYYCTEFGITTQDFPNPGAPNIKTGIYINRGRGPAPNLTKRREDAPDPELFIWDPNESPAPPTDTLRNIHTLWQDFKARFQKECHKHYSNQEQWTKFWHKVALEYRDINFREFVLRKKGAMRPGNFGGLGMSVEQARIFAVVGMGDGGWGAFYDISCLYVLRTLLFGFGDGHQLIRGKVTEQGFRHEDFPEKPRDSLEQELEKPAFLGIQSVADCLFYEQATSHTGEAKSLYEAVKESKRFKDGVHLYTGTCVRSVRLNRDQADAVLEISSDRMNREYEAVIVTAQPWSLEVAATFDNFQPTTELPLNVRQAMNSSHFITSCKVFYPLKEQYWKKSKIPQVIVTDTVLQGVYGMAISGTVGVYPGVVLVSYTWEDDATKLVADNDEALARSCLMHLDSLLVRCKNIGEKISPYVQIDAPTVWHWERSPSYRGCARLYRQGSWDLDYALLTYNQEYSAESGLYLAGEAYSVEGGWVEPALRSALDSVIHLVKNTGGRYCNAFDFERDYPKITEVA